MWGVDYDDPKWDELINNMNNGATNVYYVLILTYIATFGSAVLGIAAVFASFMVTGMRVFDAITDPIIGALMDKTNGRFGKFRPFMIIGSVIMAVSVILLYVLTPFVPANMMWLRYTLFILLYAVWVIGYTFQTSVTRAAQAVLTNDPKQRPLFTIHDFKSVSKEALSFCPENNYKPFSHKVSKALCHSRVPFFYSGKIRGDGV